MACPFQHLFGKKEGVCVLNRRNTVIFILEVDITKIFQAVLAAKGKNFYRTCFIEILMVLECTNGLPHIEIFEVNLLRISLNIFLVPYQIFSKYLFLLFW